MIARIWNAYTTFENEAAYEKLLKTRIFPYIAEKGVKGYRKVELLKLQRSADVQFITIMWFESLDDVKLFSGEDYENAVVLPETEALLTTYDKRCGHFDIVESIRYHPLS
jgi:heme-degrading monooxygenase HmoA